MILETESNWRPSATLETLKLRAQILARIREFFARRDVLEVETPVLARAATTDPNLHSFATRDADSPDRPLYLHTSPEFFMKRLLAAGSGSIYQICKVFRDAESGRRHNLEFTLLEWYRVGYDHHRLMDETTELVAHALDGRLTLAPAERLSYGEAFNRHTGIDPHAASGTELAACARAHGIQTSCALAPDDIDGWRDLLLSHIIEPRLGRGRISLVYDYPASQAALARIRPGNPPLAERFEVYLNGLELANGFNELTDASEQQQRIARDLAARRAGGLPAVPADTRFLAALSHGLPRCAGVALGMDRLIMLAAGVDSISEALAFPFNRV